MVAPLPRAAALVEPLVAHLLAEMPERRAWEREFPRGDPAARRLLLRALMNVRPPAPLDPGFLRDQDALLGADTDSTGYVSAEGRQQLSEDALAKLAECYELMKKGEIVPPSGTEYSVTDFPGLK